MWSSTHGQIREGPRLTAISSFFLHTMLKHLHCICSLKPHLASTLRKHAYSSILKILPPINEKIQIKNSDIFHICARSVDCGYSLEPSR